MVLSVWLRLFKEAKLTWDSTALCDALLREYVFGWEENAMIVVEDVIEWIFCG